MVLFLHFMQFVHTHHCNTHFPHYKIIRILLAKSYHMVDKKGCISTIVLAVIWLGSPIVFSIIMPLVSGCEKGFAVILNFIIADLSMIASAFVIFGVTFVKALFHFLVGLFKKQKTSPHYHDGEALPLSFGSSAIPTTVAIFTLAGIIAPLFANPISTSVIIAYALAGLVWGVILYILFQKEILDFDDF